MMNRLRKLITAVMPAYGFFPVIAAFAFNMFVYMGAKVIAGDWYHYNIETAWDRKLPFLPWSAAIYLGCYLFWIANYILIARQDKKSVYQFFVGDFLSRCICLFFFLVFPTTNTRPEISGGAFWDQVMAWVYSVDSADNLFPSIHCLVSWFCYIGIRGRREVPKLYRGFSCVAAILVFFSTLTTKQHVLVDVAGGVILAELCLWIGRHTSLYRGYGKIFDRLTDCFFGTYCSWGKKRYAMRQGTAGRPVKGGAKLADEKESHL